MMWPALAGHVLCAAGRSAAVESCPRNSGRRVPGHRCISILFKQTFVRLALSGLRLAAWIGRGLGAIAVYGLFKPGGWIIRRIFQFILLPLYTRYIQLKKRFRENPHFAGIESVGHFVQRYALHVGLVLLGLFGVSHNLFAQTIRPDEIGQGAIWPALTQSETADVIVENAPARPTERLLTSALAIGGPAVANAEEPAPSNAEVAPTGQPTDAVGGLSGTDTDSEQRSGVVTYTVEGGDTVSSIAVSFGLSVRTVLWANGLGENDFIKPGQTLRIPPVDGVLYTVKGGDTLAGIAGRYKGDQDKILAENDLASADALQIGQEIIIPDGEPPAPPAPPPIQRQNIFERIFVRGNNPPPSAPAGNARFIWPTTGRRINQYFRGRWHTGLDIDGDYSSPIYAGAAGTVVFAGADRSGYGLHVVINHGNGLSTLYAHASKIFVGVGDRVRQGQTIAMIGSTGRSTGTHLHYEIRSGGAPRNPFSYY